MLLEASLFALLATTPATPQRVPHAPAKTEPAPAAKSASRRQLVRRPLVITDATLTSVPEIHVAGAVPTTLAFRQPLNEKSITLADGTDTFLPVRSTSTTVQLIPKVDLPPGALATLTLTLTDGTVLPFLLTSVPQEADVQIDLEVALDKKATAESAQALKGALGQLRTQLDECTANSDVAGVSKLAALIAKDDPSQPQVFERHQVHALDKQSRLLVELKQAYRLFGHTYVLLTIENRDPSKPWVLDRPEVALHGDNQTADLKVAGLSADMASLPPGDTMKLVIAFPTPPQSLNQRVVLSLFEKNGNRHVRLENVGL